MTPPLDFKDLHPAEAAISVPPTPSTPDTDFPEWASPPPSAAPSRAPSIISKKGGSRKSSFSKSDAPPATANRPPSTAGSDVGGGQRFNLKDLLASGPKLARKPSASSRKSDASSDRGGGGGASAYGAESTTSLLKKYGVCEKVAIGKGATSVVKLAHKWDRREEKLYAVKVCGSCISSIEHGLISYLRL